MIKYQVRVVLYELNEDKTVNEQLYSWPLGTFSDEKSASDLFLRAMDFEKESE